MISAIAAAIAYPFGDKKQSREEPPAPVIGSS